MAAGLGFKTFTSGEVLTAADTNGYLMQGINVFANASARSAAITSPQEGQYSFLKDTNALEYYDGAAWVGAPVGDITAVTAGKGLTGGGSSGDVTVSLATTAKGDLVAGSGASTAAVLTVGSNGETIVADSSTSTGLRYQGSQAAAKNYLINGAMDFWQRGTSSTSLGYVTADRWYINNAGGTTTSAQETTTVPSVARYALKLTQSVSSAQVVAQQPLESQLAIPLAGQTIIVSAYVAASASTNFTIDLGQSTSTDVAAAGSWTFTSGSSQNVASLTYVRVSQTFTVSGTSKSLMPRISMTSLGSGNSFYLSGVQMEISAVPTQFTRAGGSIQGELAACQRYYYRTSGTAAYYAMVQGVSDATTSAKALFQWPVTLRTASTDITYGNLYFEQYDGTAGVNPTVTAANASNNVARLGLTGMTGLTAGRVGYLFSNASSTSYLAVNAEL